MALCIPPFPTYFFDVIEIINNQRRCHLAMAMSLPHSSIFLKDLLDIVKELHNMQKLYMMPPPPMQPLIEGILEIYNMVIRNGQAHHATMPTILDVLYSYRLRTRRNNAIGNQEVWTSIIQYPHTLWYLTGETPESIKDHR